MKLKTVGGINLPLVFADQKGVIICPFCNEEKKFFPYPGETIHKLAICSPHSKQSLELEGKTCYNYNGFYVKFPKN